MKLAPIALFVYNRPWHTSRTLEALARNKFASESDLIIFADGPKTALDQSKVDEVRSLVRSAPGFRSVTIHESEKNSGLANSIIAGVTKVLQASSDVIVMEDDLVTSSHFLAYMNSALEVYRSEEKVVSIHGYVLPVRKPLPETFLLKGADCWGWATWQRGWKLFNPDGTYLLNELKKRQLTHEFDFWGAFPYTRMLKRQIAGANDSWAVRWLASAFLQNKLTLYPGRSLVHNIGNDRSGTHQLNSTRFDTVIDGNAVEVHTIPIEENVEAKHVIADYLRKEQPSFLGKVISKLKSFLTT